MKNELLLLSLFFCHFLADFTPLSTPWMLNAKRLGTPLQPILMHAIVHSLLMTITATLFVGYDKAGILGWLQLVTHFLIDTLKGRMNGWFPSLLSPANVWHWVVFGFDQFLHAAVIILMVYLIKVL